MSGWQRVGEVAEQIRGVTYGKEDAFDTPEPGTVPVLRAGNIHDGQLVFDDLVYVRAERISRDQYLKEGDVLVATSSGSLDVVGKAARAPRDLAMSFGAFCKVLRPSPDIDSRYFAHWFSTPSYRRKVSSLAAGANINNLRNEHLDDLEVPAPSLGEQRRIADMLDKADAIRRKRKAAIALTDNLLRSTFLDMFGDPVTNPKGWPVASLDSVSDVASGVAKGKAYGNEPTMLVPYLRVANVQDGRLDLAGVKSISVPSREVERYRLVAGDVLLTEGGDPDKLGRGAVWYGEVEGCIHQNHVFRVRPTSVAPEFLSAQMGSERGKRYFLRAAKQTTGIASINMTQLKAFPLLVPPRRLQDEFVRLVERRAALTLRLKRGHALAEEFFGRLSRTAFSDAAS